MDENQVQDVDLTTADNGLDAEKTFTQSELNKIVQHRAAKAAETARRQAEEKHQRDLEALQASARGTQQDQRNETVSRDVDVNMIYQQLQEKFHTERLQNEMSQVANNYLAKMQKGPEAYEDFSDVTKDFDPTAFPQLVYLVSGLDNAVDIIYDLSKNPMKLAALDRLAEKTPQQARAELLKLSNSISQNKQAQVDEQSQQSAQPLDRLQPSRVSGSNGKMGIRDLRNQPWLRG